MTFVSEIPEFAYIVFESCSDDDADLINNTWKYRSDESIHMVRKMIGFVGLCQGVRCKADGSLVAWCLTYEEGALGMLYTIEVSSMIPCILCVL